MNSNINPVLDCPKCTGTLEQVDYEGVCLHRCEICRGLWCAPDNLRQLKKAWMADAAVDIGNPKTGEKLDDVREVNCPEGHGPMVATQDRNQKHIRYEQCPVCGGIFLDAGEFTDLKHFTPADWIRDLAAHFRSD